MRKLRARILLAAGSLRAHPLESSLMAATFAVVFCAATTALGLLRTGRREIDRALEKLGQDVVHVHDAPSAGRLLGARSSLLEEGDAARIAGALGGPAAMATVSLGAVSSGGLRLSAIVVATDPEWEEVAGIALEAGRFFERSERGACLLDDLLARDLFGGAEKALGGRVLLEWAGGSEDLAVRGVVSDPIFERARFRNLDPLASARPVLLRVLEGICVYIPRSGIDPGRGHSLCLARHPASLGPEEAVRRAREALGERGEKLFAWARRTWIERLEKMAAYGEVFSSAVWTIVLILALALVTTIALLAVSGRAVELGVRRAEGATRADVCAQILLEGLAVGGGGALLGLAASPAVGAWLSRNLFFRMSLEAEDVLLVLGGGLAGVALAYLAPALRAARLEPVEALREL